MTADPTGSPTNDRTNDRVSDEAAVGSVLGAAALRSAWRGLLPTTIALCGLVLLAAFESLAVTTVMPVVSRELDGAALYGLAFAAPLAAGVVGMVAAGTWADRVGPHQPLVVAVAVFAAGLTVAAAAPSMLLLSAGRLVQGLGGGAFVVVSYVVVARLYPADLHARVFAWFSAAWVIPSLVGPPVAGALAESVGWRWVFGSVAVIVVPVAVPVVLRVRGLGPPARTPVRGAGPRRLPWAVLAAGAVLALGLAAEVPGAMRVWLAPAAVVVALVALRPLTPPGTLVARRGLPAVVASRGLLAGAFFGAEVYLPYMLARRYGLAPTIAGVTLTAAAIAWAGASWLQGRLGRRLPSRTAIRIGTTTVAVAIAATAAVAATHAAVGWAVAAWACAGAGMGLVYARQTVLVLEYSPSGTEGANSSSLSITDSVGASLALSATGIAFAAAGGATTQSAYTTAFVLTAVLAAAAALVAPRVAVAAR
ncbi:MFS transporter [Cellulomonas composti]|uniref:MFS transporter n=1 Tax=Cellulomonas composti TaxID=266130 RepID=A0A511J999_9CELL|nr:MFS transporter [Cellulomonas composti]GEL94273.1 MFS transporter [Cellulomonas composti]